MSEDSQQTGNPAAPAGAMTAAQAQRQVDDGMACIGRSDWEGAMALFVSVEAALRGIADPELRIQFARALNGLGFVHLMQAKAERALVEEFDDQAEGAFHWGVKQALARFNQALSAQTDARCRSYAEGNKAYALMLMDRVDDATPLLRRLFGEAGRAAYDGMVRDTALHPIPEDRTVLRLLDEIWDDAGS